jgi:hypothetical protein
MTTIGIEKQGACSYKKHLLKEVERVVLSQVKSCAIYSLESFLVDVEIDISSGLPAFDNVGQISINKC